jgi:hypothetical protein
MNIYFANKPNINNFSFIYKVAKNLINGMILLKTFINNRIKDFLGRVNNVENGGIIIWTLECKGI